MASFRLANHDEDERLARILYNAFLPAWDFNWIHNVSELLPPVPLDPSAAVELTRAQEARIGFYLGIIRFTRLLGGSVSVAVPSTSKQPAAVLVWLPPRARPTLWALLRSGWLRALMSLGILAAYRIWRFESSLAELYSRVLSPLGFRHEDGGFVQIIASDPLQSGNGYATSLLQWQIEEHKTNCPGVPIFLDTTTDYAQRVYDRLGFRYLGSTHISTGRNEFGLPFGHEVDYKHKAVIAHQQTQRVMILEDPGNAGLERKPLQKQRMFKISMLQIF